MLGLGLGLRFGLGRPAAFHATKLFCFSRCASGFMGCLAGAGPAPYLPPTLLAGLMPIVLACRPTFDRLESFDPEETTWRFAGAEPGAACPPRLGLGLG